MNFVELVKHSHTSPYNAELTTKVFDTLQSRHDTVEKAKNDLYTAVMKMPMHPSENGFKMLLLKNLDDVINTNITDPRNLSDNYDDAMRAIAEVMNDPIVTDKVSWYADWLKHTNDIRNNKNLPELWKTWYLAKEPYRSPDEDPNHIPGTPYTPNIRVIEPADKYEVFKKAVGITSPTKYGHAGNRLVKNAEGKMGYINDSGRFESLNANDLWNSVKTIITGDTKTNEQLMREWMINIDTGLANNGNRNLDYPEWLFQQFSDMCTSKSYSNKFTSHKMSGFGAGSGGESDEGDKGSLNDDLDNGNGQAGEIVTDVTGGTK